MKTFFNIILYGLALIGFMFITMYAALQLGLTKTEGVIDTQHDYFKEKISKRVSGASEKAWIQTEEWQILKEAIHNDRESLTLAARAADIPSRLLAAVLVVEQLRLYYSNREIFKTVFAPLKLLGNQSQFSWGVMGIKQETAEKIEAHLKDWHSPWYLGKENEHLLDFTSNNPDKERFERLTNTDNRYFSYLYAGLLIKQLERQWQPAGFPIENEPDIVATLFNIGFENSKPHGEPRSGGAEIDIRDVKYSFGSLAKSFYDSNELIEDFPIGE